MDFGLDRLLVALEERFGKKPTDAFVLLLALGVVVFVVNLIWVDGVQPIADVFGGHANRSDLGWALIVWACGFVISFFLLSFFAAWVNRRLSKRAEKLQADAVEALASIDDAMAASKELKSVADVAHANFLGISQEVERDLATWREAGVEMAEMLDRSVEIADQLDATGNDPTARLAISKLAVENASKIRGLFAKTMQKMTDKPDEETVVDSEHGREQIEAPRTVTQDGEAPGQEDREDDGPGVPG